jgi:hypothetical protein
MRATAVFLLVGCVASAFTTDSDDVPLVKRANAWKSGEPIPTDLLVFRASHGCLPLATDTVPVFGSITNYELLQHIVFSPCDERIFTCAAGRALSLVGPNRFFGDARKQYSARPALLSQPRHRRLTARSELPHVVVDGLFIDDSDMTRDAAAAVFARITIDLRAGMPFGAVQKKYWAAHEYSYVKTLSDGTKVPLHGTRVGNYGDFIVSEQSRDARPFRLAEAPSEHVRPLLSHRTGDIVVLRDEAEHRSILYRVREFYSPSR